MKQEAEEDEGMMVADAIPATRDLEVVVGRRVLSEKDLKYI